MLRTLRVLHVIPTLGREHGGAPIACLDLCRELARRGMDVSIYTTTIDKPGLWSTDQGGRTVKDGVRVAFFPIWGPHCYWISPSMYRALKDDIPGFDVVHIHSLYRFHLPVTARLCAESGVPYIIKPHGSLDPFLFVRRRWRKWVHESMFEKPAFRGAAAIQFTTDEERGRALRTSLFRGLTDGRTAAGSSIGCLEGSSGARHAVIAEGLGNEGMESGLDGGEAFFRRFPHLRGKDIVLFLGRINFTKGLDILARAFGKIARIRPQAELVIAGPDSAGYANRVRGWLAEEGVLERTTFTGMLWNEDKWSALQAAAVFVLPSYTENFGLAVVEAMRAGCPVVISENVNIWREIRDGDAGIVVPCAVPETTEAVAGLLADPESAKRLAANAVRLVERQFSWEAVIGRMIDLYYEVAAQRSKKG